MTMINRRSVLVLGASAVFVTLPAVAAPMQVTLYKNP